MHGWSDNVPSLLKQNTDKSIILMDGYDWRCVLVDHFNVNLKRLLMAKLAHLNFKSETFYSVIKYMRKTQKAEPDKVVF